MGNTNPLSAAQPDLTARLQAEVDSLKNLDEKIIELSAQGNKEFAELLRSVSEKIRGALQALENIITENNAQTAEIPQQFAPEVVLAHIAEDIKFVSQYADTHSASTLVETQEYQALSDKHGGTPPPAAQTRHQEFIVATARTIERQVAFSAEIAEARSYAALAAEVVLPDSFYSGVAMAVKKDLAIFLPYIRKEAQRIAVEKYTAGVRAQVQQEIIEQEAHDEAVRMLTPFAKMVMQGIIDFDDYQNNEKALASGNALEANRARLRKTVFLNPNIAAAGQTDLELLYPALPAAEQDILRDAFTAALQKMPTQDLLKTAKQYHSLPRFQQEALFNVLKNRLTDIETADLQRLATQIPGLKNAIETELVKRGELSPPEQQPALNAA